MEETAQQEKAPEVKKPEEKKKEKKVEVVEKKTEEIVEEVIETEEAATAATAPKQQVMLNIESRLLQPELDSFDFDFFRILFHVATGNLASHC